MNRILHVICSPRGERSYAAKVSGAFLRAYQRRTPSATVDTLDVFSTELPAFDGLAVQAKYTILHGQEHTAVEREAWRRVETVIERFKQADLYVMAVPMWNFGLPYRLKQYIDLIVQPGYTFSFTPADGFKGLLSDKRAFVAYSRGGEYASPQAAMSFDFQRRHLELVLGFMGIGIAGSVVVEPTLAGGPEVASEKLKSAIAEAERLAATV